MSKQNRDRLLIEVRNKGLTMTVLAEQVGCSISMISKYFRNQTNLSKQKEDLLVQFINKTKMYEWKKVEVK